MLSKSVTAKQLIFENVLAHGTAFGRASVLLIIDMMRPGSLGKVMN